MTWKSIRLIVLRYVPHSWFFSLTSQTSRPIDRLAIDPRSVGKPLVGRMGGLWSARVGNYRVLYTIEGSPASLPVVVREITHRAVAYRRRRQK